jgi:hypothetical protein
VVVLTGALAAHDVEFSRAEAGLRIDLTLAYLAYGDAQQPASSTVRQFLPLKSLGRRDKGAG